MYSINVKFLLFILLQFLVVTKACYGTNVLWFLGFQNNSNSQSNPTVKLPSLSSEPEIFTQLMAIDGVNSTFLHDVSDFKMHLNQKAIAVLMSDENGSEVLGYALVEKKGKVSVILDPSFQNSEAAKRGAKPLLLEIIRWCGYGTGLRFKDGIEGYFKDNLRITIQEAIDLGFERTETFTGYGDTFRNTSALNMVLTPVRQTDYEARSPNLGISSDTSFAKEPQRLELFESEPESGCKSIW